MTRTESITYILERHAQRKLSTEAATERLEALRVRGGFDGDKFTGYDYHEQKWVTH